MKDVCLTQFVYTCFESSLRWEVRLPSPAVRPGVVQIELDGGDDWLESVGDGFTWLSTCWIDLQTIAITFRTPVMGSAVVIYESSMDY